MQNAQFEFMCIIRWASNLFVLNRQMRLSDRLLCQFSIPPRLKLLPSPHFSEARRNHGSVRLDGITLFNRFPQCYILSATASRALRSS